MSMVDRPLVTQQEKLVALYEVSARLGTTLQLPGLLNYVMDSIIQLTGAERGLLVLFDELTGEWQTAAARSHEGQDIASDSAEISRTVIRRAAEGEAGVLTNNAQEDTRFAAQQSVVGYQLRSIMCAPLKARDRVIGAAYVDNRLLSGVFDEEALNLLVAFANQAAMAIDNARLFAQTDQALARRVQELNLFQRIDQELNRELDLDRVLRLALDWAIGLTNADNGSIGLLEVDVDTQIASLRLRVYQGGPTPARPRTIPLDHPVLAEVLATGRSVLTNQVRAELSIDGSSAAAQLAVPIRKEGEVTGLITLESRRPLAFDNEDIVFVERLADRAAVAIENARLYEAVRAANEAKSQFISVVTHEMRLPLTSVKGYTDLIARGLAGPLTDQQKQFFEVVDRNLERMSRLITDLADINRIETGRMRFEPEAFDLRQAVDDVADSLREAITARHQTLRLALPEAPLMVWADFTRTSQALSNLVSNAHKYTPDAGRITVTLAQEGDMALAQVADNGLGISPADQARLFTQFFRSDDQQVREQNGWGLGLSIVKMLVEKQGGEISYTSTYRQGSVFSFTVPLAGADGSAVSSGPAEPDGPGGPAGSDGPGAPGSGA